MKSRSRAASSLGSPRAAESRIDADTAVPVSRGAGFTAGFPKGAREPSLQNAATAVHASGVLNPAASARFMA